VPANADETCAEAVLARARSVATRNSAATLVDDGAGTDIVFMKDVMSNRCQTAVESTRQYKVSVERVKLHCSAKQVRHCDGRLRSDAWWMYVVGEGSVR